MTVLIDKKRPVLNFVIQAAKEFAGYRNVTIKSGLSEDDYSQKCLTGLALDTCLVLQNLYPFKINVMIKNFDHEGTFSINEKEGYTKYGGGMEEESAMNLILDTKHRFSYESCQEFEKKATIETYDNSMGKILIEGLEFNEKYPVRSLLNDEIEKRIPNCLPKKTNEIRIFFSYMSLAGFSVNTVFQDFEPIDLFQRSDKEIKFYYPIITKFNRNTKLGKKAWDFIDQPLFWNAWDQWNEKALHVFCGRTTNKKIGYMYRMDSIHVKRHMQKAMIFAHKFIYAMTSDDPTKILIELCNEYRCSPEYRSFFLKKTLNAFNFITHPSRQNLEETRVMIKNYNIFSNKKYSVANEMTIEKLCYRNPIELDLFF